MGSYFWGFFPPPIYLSALIPLYISAASHLPHYTWETSARIWPSAYETCLQTFHTWITVWKFTNKKIQNIIQAVYQHLVVGFFFFFFLPQEWKIWLFSLLTKSSLAWKLDSCSFQLRVRKKKRAPWIRVGFPGSSVTADGETWLEAVLTNDCHQRIKIPYVKALSGNVNEEFNDLCSLFLFCRLQIKINKYL